MSKKGETKQDVEQVEGLANLLEQIANSIEDLKVKHNEFVGFATQKWKDQDNNISLLARGHKVQSQSSEDNMKDDPRSRGLLEKKFADASLGELAEVLRVGLDYKRINAPPDHFNEYMADIGKEDFKKWQLAKATKLP